jgi:hypothetical protein
LPDSSLGAVLGKDPFIEQVGAGDDAEQIAVGIDDRIRLPCARGAMTIRNRLCTQQDCCWRLKSVKICAKCEA